MTTAMPHETLSGLLPADLALGEPDAAGALVVYPLLAASSELEYRSFAEGAAHGFAVRELDPPSVNDVLAVNPLPLPVLLYEGEEVRGAQQDRTVDVSVLVPAGAAVEVPVSCVEEGRWDGSRHDESFAPSPTAAFPSLRAAKNRHARAATRAGSETRADQHAVWEAVADRSGPDSPTGAMRDVFDAEGDRLAELEAAFRRRDGQVGALACVGGRLTVVDYVSRSDVFAGLFAPLLRGYCLDALDLGDAVTPGPSAGAFLSALVGAPVQRHRAVALGDAVTFTGDGLGGTGLAVDGQLVQLSAFSEDGPGHRIARPSRRR